MAVVFCSSCGTPLLADGTCTRCALPTATPALTTTRYGQTPPPIADAPLYASVAPATRFSGMWNWGAFLLCPFWLMNHGALGFGIGYLVLSLIPLLNIATLGMGIYFGIKGNDWAVAHRTFADEAQFVAVQNAWRNWGFILFAVGLVLSITFGIIVALTGALTGTHPH